MIVPIDNTDSSDTSIKGRCYNYVMTVKEKTLIIAATGPFMRLGTYRLHSHSSLMYN